jgi:hypothetical protein
VVLRGITVLLLQSAFEDIRIEGAELVVSYNLLRLIPKVQGTIDKIVSHWTVVKKTVTKEKFVQTVS